MTRFAVRPGRPSVLARTDLSPALARSADRHGVATWYTDQSGRARPVGEATIRAVLAALGVPEAEADRAAGPEAQRAAGPEAHRASAPPPLAPPVLVVRAGTTRLVDLHPPRGATVRAEVVTDSGVSRSLPVRDGPSGAVAVLGNGLPLGWHQLRLATGSQTTVVPLAVAPFRLPRPERAWGWSTQLYATRSAAGWGVGDLSDLRVLAEHAGARHGADFILVNPLHAAATAAPMQPSPYTPGSRRFIHPLYIRVEETAAYREASAQLRAEVDALRPGFDPQLIDRDRAWAGIEAALRILWRARPGIDLAGFRADHPGVDEFATWCAIAAEHGPDYRRWPAGLRRPEAPAVAAYRQAHRTEVDFHVWCQSLADAQLHRAAQAARDCGMRVGIVHDLAVGVDPGGADAWALQDVLAGTMSVGAPPDDFNQQGQNWGLPPWHPKALRERAYQPFRQMVAAVLRHAGGLRVDHILGLFRLWWVPPGSPPADGTYVRYPAHDLLGVLALEAARAGALVVGEDLGTVPSQVQGELASRGVLGTSVLWFEREGGRPRRFERWRAEALAAVTTHDLPTAAGFLALEHVRLRGELGLLRRDPQEELAVAAAERDQLVGLLEEEGLVKPGASPAELVAGMHAGLARAPARLLSVFLPDAVGDLRQPNLPGTVDEYPNWSLPIATPEAGGHRPLTLEEILRHPGVARLARILAEGLAERILAEGLAERSGNLPAEDTGSGRDS
ncbi:MAG: 4-alpha-glucanotransferase [Mycobacteriales bacterium]